VIAHVPIIGIDIWEHAFYLQYKNVKPDVSSTPLDIYIGKQLTGASTSRQSGMSSTSRRQRSDCRLLSRFSYELERDLQK
jgi:hypothetical protein